MDYAIAMYTNNYRLVYASDKNINYKSFKRILCLECHQPVYLKCKAKGSSRKAHFAHYSSFNRNYSLRITSKNQNWRSLTHVGRDQRQDKFYEYFNYMITKDDEVVRIIQEVENSCSVKDLQKLTQECLNWLISNASSLREELTITSKKSLDEQSILKIIMRSESIDFLTRRDTRKSLTFLVYYFFYKTCDFQIYTNLSSWLNECSVDHIIPELKKIIIETDWGYIFGYHHRHGTFPQKDKEEKSQDKEETISVRKIQDIKQICCFLHIKHSLNVQVRGTSLSGKILLQKQNNLFICFTNYTRTVKKGMNT